MFKDIEELWKRQWDETRADRSSLRTYELSLKIKEGIKGDIEWVRKFLEEEDVCVAK